MLQVWPRTQTAASLLLKRNRTSPRAHARAVQLVRRLLLVKASKNPANDAACERATFQCRPCDVSVPASACCVACASAIALRCKAWLLDRSETVSLTCLAGSARRLADGNMARELRCPSAASSS